MLDGYEHIKHEKSGKTLAIIKQPGENEVRKLPLGQRSAVTTASAQAKASDFLSVHLPGFGNVDPADLILNQTQSDEFGMTHLRYGQTYQGIPVFGSELLVHLDPQGEIKSVNGAIVEVQGVSTQPGISRDEAVLIGKNYLAQRRGKELVLALGNTDLYIYDPSRQTENDPEPRLVYAVELQNEAEVLDLSLFVDAHSGKVVHQEDHVKRIGRKIYDCSLNPADCLLDETDSQYPGYIFGRSEGQAARGKTPVPGPGSRYLGRNDVDDLYTKFERVHNFVFSMFHINGANHQGGITFPGGIYETDVTATRGHVYIDQTSYTVCPDAYFFSDYLGFCAGETQSDMIGHEYGHSIVRGIFGLPNNGSKYGMGGAGESGSMEEGFADILGETFEFSNTGVGDWRVDGTSEFGTLRSLSAPNTTSGYGSYFAQRTYDPYRLCGGSGQIYNNATILGKAAHLMSVGGTLNGCTVLPVGRKLMLKILYRAISYYFNSAETFADSYYDILIPCAELASPEECVNVRYALQATEIDQVGKCVDPSGIYHRTPTCALADKCPYDPYKTEPGVCDCNTHDGDYDGDGTVNCMDNCTEISNRDQNDSDYDGRGDACDLCPLDGNKTRPGNCGCGRPEGACATEDLCPGDPSKTVPGICGCGTADVDADGDGVLDCYDRCPGAVDDDQTDSDNDGVGDACDGCPYDPLKTSPALCGCWVPEDTADTDGDNTINCRDKCPEDPNKTATGICGCGYADVDTNGSGTVEQTDCSFDFCVTDANKKAPQQCGCGRTETDSDADGIANCFDNCRSVANATQSDTDGDSIGDACDNAPLVPNPDQADSDGDVTGNAVDNCPFVSNADQLDTDVDGAGDACDQCPANPGKIAAGQCGCGSVDIDSDGDSAYDCFDLCAFDPAKIDPGICGCSELDVDRNGDGTVDCPNTWAPTSTTGAPSGRFIDFGVWTGSKMIVWGGVNSQGYLNTGALYDPATNTWSPMSTVDAPVARTLHTAVWNGSKMIVWGGQTGAAHGSALLTNTGGVYDPVLNSWTEMSTDGAPSARQYFSAVAAGSKLIVWGGIDANYQQPSTGAIYDPDADAWTPMTTVNAPSGRIFYSAAWTGNRLIIWGGSSNGTLTRTGGVYEPDENRWTPTTTTNAPQGRFYHSTVWSGQEMLVWGGAGDGPGYFLNNGGRYNPAANTWSAISTTAAPTPRWHPSAVWSGSRLMVWGGLGTAGKVNTGGLYDPATNAWSEITTAGAPSVRSGHAAAWTGTAMIIWGGELAQGGADNSGGIYTPPTISPGPFNINGPSGTIYDDTPNVSWQPATGAVSYELTISTASDCSVVTRFFENITGTTYTVETLAQGTYYLCVKAVDNAGRKTSAINNGLQFTVSDAAQIHMVFVTSFTTGITTDQTVPPASPSHFGGSNAADWICTHAAYNSGILSEWNGLDLIYKAILSTTTSSVKNRIQIVGPIYNLQNEFVAGDATDFWDGRLSAPINVNEFGNLIPDYFKVWSGSSYNGTPVEDTCGDWIVSSSSTAGSLGDSTRIDRQWLQSSIQWCDQTARLYCISPALGM